jgi:uncharacterized membrane protein
MSTINAARAEAPIRRELRRSMQGPRTRNSGSCQRVNVGDTERWASAAIGGGLAAYGLAQKSLSGLALAAIGGCLAYRGVTGHCELYRELGISTAEPRGPMTSIPSGQGIKIEESIVIHRPPEVIYNYWRNLENLPKVMRHLESVEVEGKRSHWKAKAPAGMSVEWDAEIINQRPNELIAWRSLEGSTVDTAGSVHFRTSPSKNCTEVRVVLKYDPPAGKTGAVIAHWIGEAPEQQIAEDLRAFKQQMETGEAISSSTRSPSM